VIFATSDAKTLRGSVEDALELIRLYDPHQLVRLKRHVRGVLVFGTHGGEAEWRGEAKLIRLFEDYVARPPLAADLADVLVHEAAHAWLEDRGCEYLEGRRHRIEAICVNAQRRFNARVPGRAAAAEHNLRQIEHVLSRPEDWTDSAFRERTLARLRELGTPRSVIALLDKLTKRRAG
jgi:hypothetical protein